MNVSGTHTHSANQIDGGIVCYIDNYVGITARKNGRIPDLYVAKPTTAIAKQDYEINYRPHIETRTCK